MSFFDELRKKMGRSEPGVETNPKEQVERIEDLKARNLLDLRELEDRADLIERKIRQEEEALNAEGISKTEEDRHARRIVLLETELNSVRERIALYFDNASLHLKVISNVQEMQAMRAVGVSEGQLDSLAERRKALLDSDARIRLARNDLIREMESPAVTEQNSVIDAAKKRHKHADTERVTEVRDPGAISKETE
jgi:hypothetical protein